MDSAVIENWDYVAAWIVYLVAGGGIALIFWRLSAGMRQVALRDLLRWILLVLIFTPWYAGPAYDFLAPAAAVLMFDVLLNESESGFASGIVLLVLILLVILALIVRELWRGRKAKGSA